MVQRNSKECRILVGAIELNTLNFWKVQTVGNDFVLVMLSDVVGSDLSQLAIAICDRHFGVGSDGLLVVSKTPSGLSLRMFNSDGTEDFCGNGLRCAAWFGFTQKWVNGQFTINHGGKYVPVEVSERGLVSITFEPASFAPELVPVSSTSPMIDQSIHGVIGTAITTGSTHFVSIVDQLPRDKEFYLNSPKIEHDPIFPERTSIMYIQEIGPAHLSMRIWERGVGETLGCGTGASAAAVVWARKKAYCGEIKISSKGGDIIVRLRGWDQEITSESRPEITFEGSYLLSAESLALV